MKYIPFFLIVFQLLSGCYRTIEKMSNTDNNIILSYPAVNDYNVAASGINYWNRALINPDLNKTIDTLLFSLNIPQALNKDITVNIGIDEPAIATYNKDTLFGSAQYELMPANYYSITQPTVVMPAGKTDTTIALVIKPNLFDISKTGYLLPLTITSADGIAISSMKTAYIHIEKDPAPPYGRADWTVVGFSSQEPAGEGPNSGRVIHMFDNNNSTFWHSKWQGGNDPLPYWFTIDMHTSNILHGVMILPRQGADSHNGRPKNAKVEVSNDGSMWTLAGNITIADNASWQKFTFSNPTTASRYFKITISSVYGDVSYSNIAELKMF